MHGGLFVTASQIAHHQCLVAQVSVTIEILRCAQNDTVDNIRMTFMQYVTLVFMRFVTLSEGEGSPSQSE